MKKTCAALISLLLLAAQFFPGLAGPASSSGPASCRCVQADLDCPLMRCCATKHTPDSGPVPAAPVRTTSPAPDLQALALGLTLWTLPDASTSNSDSSPVSCDSFVGRPAVPLFARDCALLL